MSDVVKELRASVAMDAMSGDALERQVCANQMARAAAEIERLRAERLEPTLYQQRLQEQRDACRRLLREAVKCDPNVYWLSREWHQQAARAAGGGE